MKHLFTISILLLLESSWCLAVESFMMLDRSGNVKPVQLTLIGSDEIELMDSESGFSTMPKDECIAFIRPNPTPVNTIRPMLRLHDGQVFPGSMGMMKSREHVIWEHDWLGTLRIPVERIDRITMGRVSPSSTSLSDADSDVDLIRLVNGDVLRGFVSQIGDPIVIEIDGDGNDDGSSIPLDRVREIDLFGEKQPTGDSTIWAVDGTIATIPTIELREDSRIRSGHHALRVNTIDDQLDDLPLKKVHAISLSGSGFTPLSGLEPESVSHPSIRVSRPGPMVTDASAPMGLSPIGFRGPVTVRYRLPDGRLRLSSTVRIPTTSLDWGDCILVLRVDDVEVHRVRLNESNPESRIELIVKGTDFEMELLDGANGPVQDHLQFEYAVFIEQ